MGVPFLFQGSSANIIFGKVLQVRMDEDGYENLIILA